MEKKVDKHLFGHLHEQKKIHLLHNTLSSQYIQHITPQKHNIYHNFNTRITQTTLTHTKNITH